MIVNGRFEMALINQKLESSRHFQRQKEEKKTHLHTLTSIRKTTIHDKYTRTHNLYAAYKAWI